MFFRPETAFLEDLMKTLALLGLQWGDEGKGKIIDHLAREYDVTIRFQGGGNAGHTVVVDDCKYILHHIPSGILHEGKTAYIGDGTVLDIDTLLTEMSDLASKDIDLKDRLFIGWGTHLVMPYHKELDGAAEAEAGDACIGTTRRGIGPCYADRKARLGVRFRDIFHPSVLRARLTLSLKEKNVLFAHLYGRSQVKVDEMVELCLGWAATLEGFGRNTPQWIKKTMEEGKSVLFEGAQGTLLDTDWGTYPFVTSSTTSISAVSHGLGISPRRIDRVMGVIKAYTTRVGMGPFPTELDDHAGKHLRDQGDEYGSTTGRPRRCGWLDAVAGRYAVELNGVDTLVLTKLDVLSGLEEIKVCTSYGSEEGFVPDPTILADLDLGFTTFPGWSQDISKARCVADLPDACRDYLRALPQLLGAPVGMVSVGPERRQVFETE
jgi:adenylosuccinate synthase